MRFSQFSGSCGLTCDLNWTPNKQLLGSTWYRMGLEHGIFFMAHLGSADFTGRLCIKWSDPSHHVSEDQAVQEASGGS